MLLYSLLRLPSNRSYGYLATVKMISHPQVSNLEPPSLRHGALPIELGRVSPLR